MSIEVARVIAVLIFAVGMSASMYLRLSVESYRIAGPSWLFLSFLIVLMPWLGNEQNVASQRIPPGVFVGTVAAAAVFVVGWSVKYRR